MKHLISDLSSLCPATEECIKSRGIVRPAHQSLVLSIISLDYSFTEQATLPCSDSTVNGHSTYLLVLTNCLTTSHRHILCWISTSSELSSKSLSQSINLLQGLDSHTHKNDDTKCRQSRTICLLVKSKSILHVLRLTVIINYAEPVLVHRNQWESDSVKMAL